VVGKAFFSDALAGGLYKGMSVSESQTSRVLTESSSRGAESDLPVAMAPPAGYDPAALGWFSQKRTFKRKYVCVRPKYTVAKLEGIKRHIYRIKMEQLVLPLVVLAISCNSVLKLNVAGVRS
jgi:hypothetical protein